MKEKTTTATKTDGLSRKIQTQEIVAYHRSFFDLLQVLWKLSLTFQMNN